MADLNTTQQQPPMAFSCSGLTLKLHVLERPCMFSFMISILTIFVLFWIM
ncbi:hypothetical protein Hdeb2414_s0025g00656211 [Helianthus debilis subsp. tardiflorus]